ncbi:MAG: hypothetical protein U5L11_00650 [Arhodomonas sp.]|nr:hypothetical protein [Arhodomonas sp.]
MKEGDGRMGEALLLHQGIEVLRCNQLPEALLDADLHPFRTDEHWIRRRGDVVTGTRLRAIASASHHERMGIEQVSLHQRPSKSLQELFRRFVEILAQLDTTLEPAGFTHAVLPN